MTRVFGKNAPPPIWEGGKEEGAKGSRKCTCEHSADSVPFGIEFCQCLPDNAPEYDMEDTETMSALGKQEGGGHYKDFPIQPIVFCQQNKLGFIESCVVKRMCRWREKGGIGDLRKAIHEIEVLIELTEMAEKREHMEREARITSDAEHAVQAFLASAPFPGGAVPQGKGPPDNRLGAVNPEWPLRECTCHITGPMGRHTCQCPPDELMGSQEARAEAAVYDRGNPHHYRLTPGLELPTDLPDGTVVEGPASAMQWVRLGVMHRGQLVRDGA